MALHLIYNSSRQPDYHDLQIKSNHDPIMTNPLYLFLLNEFYQSQQLDLSGFANPKFELNSFSNHPKLQLFGLIYVYSKQSQCF